METKEKAFNEERFWQTLKTKPRWTSIVVFSQIIKRKNLTESKIRKNFYKFVDKEDWAGTPIKEILDWLYNLSKRSKKALTNKQNCVII